MRSVVVPLAVMLAIHVVISMAALTLPVIAPAAAAEAGLAPGLVGFYTSLLYAGSMVTSLLSGALIARFGAVRLAQAGLALAAAGLLAATGGEAWLFAVSAVLVGLGHGPVTPVGAHVLMGRTPSGVISLVFSIKQTGVPLGLAAAGALVPPLAVAFGWRMGVVAVAVACAGLALALQGVRAGLDSDRSPGSRLSAASVIEPVRLALRIDRLRELTFVSCAYGVAQFCFASFFVVYVTGRLGVELVAAGLYFSAAQAAGIAGRMAWGAVADRTGAPRAVLGLIGILAGIASLLTAALAPGWPGAAMLAVSVLFGFTVIGWNGVLLAEVARQAPEGRAGAATGGVLVIFAAAIMAGPSSFSLVVTGSGSYGLGYGLVALLVLALAVPLLRPLPRSSGAGLTS